MRDCFQICCNTCNKLKLGIRLINLNPSKVCSGVTLHIIVRDWIAKPNTFCLYASKTLKSKVNEQKIEEQFLFAIRHHVKWEELWLPVKGYNNYEVSSQGRMRRTKTNKIMKQKTDLGYCSRKRLINKRLINTIRRPTRIIYVFHENGRLRSFFGFLPEERKKFQGRHPFSRSHHQLISGIFGIELGPILVTYYILSYNSYIG